MTLGAATAAGLWLIVWCKGMPASGRAQLGRDGCSVRRRNDRARLARAACRLGITPPAGRTSPVREGIIEDCTPRDPHPVSRHRRPAIEAPPRRIDGLVPSEQSPAPGSIAVRGRRSGGPQSPPNARPDRHHPTPARYSSPVLRCLAACSTPTRWRARHSARLSRAGWGTPGREHAFRVSCVRVTTVYRRPFIPPAPR